MNSKSQHYILISGASGLVGQKLVPMLLDAEYRVITLGRSERGQFPCDHVSWNQLKSGECVALEHVTHIVHLAGSNIGSKRWTDDNKTEFINSRVDSAALLRQVFTNHKHELSSYISASATGYYGLKTTEKIYVEQSANGSDFAADLCEKWEASADAFESISKRVLKLRIGIVLSPKGGALKKMIGTTRLGVGSALGSGKQWFPWIHIDDLAKVIFFSIENETVEGVYNAVAPEHATNRDVNKALAAAMNKPFWAPNVPSFLLKRMFGEMSEILLGGSRISSQKILDTGFSFDHPVLKTALKNLVGND